jgi:2-polyprenyl-3-methyl-5-hydroxy-6-metoxy-1,4-benzoquinol methylase
MHEALRSFYETKYSRGEELSRSSKRYTLDCVADGGGLHALDVGCGTGLNSQAIRSKGHNVLGIDIAERAIEAYRARGLEGRVMDIEKPLLFPDESFDLVFCSEVIEHLGSPEILIREARRVLKPGGRLIVSTPNSAFWLYRVLGLLGYTVGELQHPKHFQFFSLRSLRRLLREAGLREIDALGRNMYLILPDVPRPLRAVLEALGFQREPRFRTGTSFWHLSHKSRFWNRLLADTLILVSERPR